MPLPPPVFLETSFPTTFVSGRAGLLVTPHQLEFAVYDTSNDAKRAQPVQVYPETGRAVPEVISRGYYRAVYQPASAEPRGRRLVRWWCVLELGGPTATWTTDWEVLQNRVEGLFPLYATVSDIRDEGYTPSDVSDLRAQLVLFNVSQFITHLTKRSFIPVPKLLSVHRHGPRRVHLPEEVVALDDVYEGRGRVEQLRRDNLVVYNRHLSQRLLSPDDRNNPKVELDGDSFCRRGEVHVAGVWGYTEADGSPMGRTPARVKQAALLLFEKQRHLVSSGASEENSMARRVTMERTREQTIMYATPTAAQMGTPLQGAFTGDPDVDMLLASLIRPPGMGAA